MKACPVPPPSMWTWNFPCGLIPHELPAWYLQGSANEWAGRKECIFWSLFSLSSFNEGTLFWRLEHLTCLMLSVRMQIYLFKSVFKVTLITGLPTDRAVMIIQRINQGKNYASYWLTNYWNQIFNPLFGTIGTALGKGDNNTKNPQKNPCLILLWAGEGSSCRGLRKGRGLQLGPLSPCFHSSTSLPAPACNVLKD